MFTTFTDSFEPNSTAVEAAYYNNDDNTLAVVLWGGGTYEYANVPASEWYQFKNARSAGRYYATSIKRNYGPGTYIGFNADEDFEEKSYEAADMSAVGTPKDLTYSTGAIITSGFTSGTIASAQPANISAGNINPATVPMSAVRVTLGTPAAKTTLRHSVKFTVDGVGNNVRTYNVDVSSVDEAVAALNEAGSALGLTLNVKEVTVYFE